MVSTVFCFKVFAELVEIDTNWMQLPTEVASVLTLGHGFLPLATAAEHGITDRT
jgi:hypothetical protein